jgi:hypothetical protein
MLASGAVLFIAGLLAWEYVPLTVTIWDGAYDLKVNVRSTAGQIQFIDCRVVSAEGAEELLMTLPPPTNQFVGPSQTVSVPTSGRLSPCGRELQRFQFRHLVVIAQLNDGRRFGKVISIPDTRESREVSVSVP